VGGVVHPEFESESALYALLGPVMQFYNQTASAFLSGPEDFKPLFWQMTEDWISEDWCHGFCLGMRLAADDWRPLLTTQPDLFLPFISLGTSAELDTSLSDEQLAEFEDAVVPNLLVIALLLLILLQQLTRLPWQGSSTAVPPPSAADLWLAPFRQLQQPVLLIVGD
ncbi:MAG: UPF0149 family protein, partial [Inhella sp.]